MKLSNLVLLLAASLFTAACGIADPDLAPVEDSAKAWLHEQDGQRLAFRNATGQTQTLQVSRVARVEKNTAGYYITATPTEHIYLTYRRPTPPDSGFTIKVTRNVLEFQSTVKPNYRAPGLGGVFTAADESQEKPATQTSQLLRNHVLGARTYASLVEVAASSDYYGSPTPAPYLGYLSQLYYSKNDGLAAFRTLDGQLWLRQ